MSDVIRISEQGKRQLIALKRSTKIDRWNILCRWALFVSISDETQLTNFDLGPISNIEMTWATFLGPYKNITDSLLLAKNRHEYKKIDLSDMYIYNLHRGISKLAQKRPSAPVLINYTQMKSELLG